MKPIRGRAHRNDTTMPDNLIRVYSPSGAFGVEKCDFLWDQVLFP